ncbi:MAG: Type 1 glutamine amidotransferase-like domain-containing protein [Patescibacteria group bacterium]
MTKFILHGGFARTRNELNKSFFTEMVSELSDGDIVLLVYFSREDNEYEKLTAQDTTFITECAGETKVQFEVANKEFFIDQIKSAKAIYFRGGITDKLLATVNEHPEFVEAIQGKIVAGSSAGVYLFSTYYHSASTGKINKGLGLLPIRVICHFESEAEEFDVNEQSIQDMEKYSQDLELVVLHDFEWKVFEK